MTPETKTVLAVLKTLPGDDVRQIMWRFSDRYDVQMLIQSVRSVARGPVARLVAAGGRNSHEWTEEKAALLKAFDESGITAAFMDADKGGFIEGPKNLVLAMIAFELCWVDAGAATCSLAGNLALSPIYEKGTKEQKERYLGLSVPLRPGENRKVFRGAFALTEPLPYVGVETGMVSGSLKVSKWEEGKEPILHVEKRGRFITNIGFANFISAAVDSADPRIKGSCMIVLEDIDPGTFDRGTPTKKLVHQLSSTGDPIFSLDVPASRIIGGYTIKDGIIIPRFSHGEIIDAVFHHTRVTVALMSTSKLLSAIEPVIRYQRNRFRGAENVSSGTPRFELGLQQKEDCLQRLIDIWATGEASASFGFTTARLFDELDPMTHEKNQYFEKQGITGARAQMKALSSIQQRALEYLQLNQRGESERVKELSKDQMVQFILKETLANVLCPGCKLWNTGFGATMMREAVSLMGGYGITEDCPGFLGSKWMDIQLEATYEGPEAVQRRQLSITMTNELFLAQMRKWGQELKVLDEKEPQIGAGALYHAMELWFKTLDHVRNMTDANGQKLGQSNRHGVMFSLADALCWILGSYFMIMDTIELQEKGPLSPTVAEGLDGLLSFYKDLCFVQAARTVGEVGKICTELMYGYRSKVDDCCCERTFMEDFQKLRSNMDSCVTGARLAKDRAADALTGVMIPEALDYPQ